MFSTCLVCDIVRLECVYIGKHFAETCCIPGLQDLQWKAVAQAADMAVHAIGVPNQGRCCAGRRALIHRLDHALLEQRKA